MNITFYNLQGLTILVSTQEKMLRMLADDSCCEGCVKGPILQIVPMETNKDTYVKGTYFSTRTDAEEHIRYKDLFVRSTMQQLKEDEYDAYDEILRSMRVL